MELQACQRHAQTIPQCAHHRPLEQVTKGVTRRDVTLARLCFWRFYEPIQTVLVKRDIKIPVSATSTMMPAILSPLIVYGYKEQWIFPCGWHITAVTLPISGMRA